MVKLQRFGLVMGMWLLISARASATTYAWNGTAGTTELWTSNSNWTPAGFPGEADTDLAIFDSGSNLLHDIIMPNSEMIEEFEMVDGLFQFRAAGGTPWLFNVREFGSEFSGSFVLSAEDGGEVELRLRNGDLDTDAVLSIGTLTEDSSTILDAEDSSLFAEKGLSLGDNSASNSTALLKLTNSQLTAFNTTDIGDGGVLEVVDNSEARLLGFVTLAGDLLVADGGHLETTTLLNTLGSSSVSIGPGGRMTSGRVSVGGTMLVSGAGGVTAELDVCDYVQGGDGFMIGNLGEVRTARIFGTANLLAGGFLQVPAEFFEITPANFVWTGGELEFLGDFHIDTAGALNPFGASMTVATGRTLDVGPTGGDLHVGTTTQGALTIAGGTVTSDTAIIGGSIAATGPATVIVSGSTGRWNVEGTLRAGGLGTAAAAISVSGGADVVVIDAHIATLGKIANFTIDGVGSSMVSSDSVFLGGDAAMGGGQGTLALTNSGIIGVGNSADDQLKVWDGYVVTMNQAAISARNLVVRGIIAPAAGALISGNIAVVNSVVIDGGSVTLTTFGPASLIASSNVDVLAGGSLNGYIHGNSGTQVLVTGGSSSWTTPNVVANVLGTTTSGVGRIRQLTVGSGGTVNFGAGVSYAAGATDGLVLFDGTLNAPTFNGGTVGVTGRGVINATYSGSGPIQATGPLSIGNATTVNGFATTGQISVGANTLTLNDLDAAQVGPGTLLGSSGVAGTLVAPNGLTIESGETVFGFGTINTPDDPTKRLTNDGIISGTGTAQRLTLPGDVTGIGAFNNVEFTGTFSPGNALFGLTTALTSGSNYKFTDSSVLRMDILGATPGFGYDVIFSTGQFVADGTLAVALHGGYIPTAGQTFDLLDFTTLTGTFDFVNLPLLPGLNWDTSQLYTQGRLSVVAAAFLQADFDEDGDVDATDLGIWKEAFNLNQLGDADGDNDSDGADFLVWQQQFGATRAGAANSSVPEPGSLMLFIVAAAGLRGLGGRMSQQLVSA